jgi:yecA family protein
MGKAPPGATFCYDAPVRIEQEALEEHEIAELSELLVTTTSATLDFARGVFAAVATAPTRLEPAEWLTQIFSERPDSSPEFRRAFDLLLRDYNSTADCLALGVPAVPAPDEEAAIQQFCKGYIRIAQRDKKWTTEQEAFAFTMPLAILSGYLDLDALPERDVHGIDDLETYRREQSVKLIDTVAALYQHFDRERRAAREAASQKVGRNDPCPCGSGKKYKKCCG